MQRVLVIGSPGTGKTTFARKLAAQTQLPLIHLDRHYHDKTKDYYNEINQEAWFKKVDELVAADKWIIEGNFNSTLERRVKRADTIIFFDLPRRTALAGVLKRRVQLHGKQRVDMPPDWKEHLDWGFLHYIWKYPRVKRPKVLEIITAPAGKTVVVFRRHSDAEAYVSAMMKRA